MFKHIRGDPEVLRKMRLPTVKQIEKKYKVKVICAREKTVEEWFRKNYESLGFSYIRRTKGGVKDPGDYVGFRNGKCIRIELELFSSGFFLHKKEIRNKISMIICVERNTSKLNWKVEELQNKEIVELKALWNVNEIIAYGYEYDYLVDTDPNFREQYRELLWNGEEVVVKW